MHYHSRATSRPTQPLHLPTSSVHDNDAKSYIADDGLAHAVNTALMLGSPLLVTGDPGAGKTRLAFSIAYQLGFEPPLIFVCKSVSQAADLFYNFDVLGRFKASHASDQAEAQEFIRYNALGRAILYANPREDVAELMPSWMKHPGKAVRSVVLVDEIDKAPRDFPNDVLSEVENMEFQIPELIRARPVTAKAEFKPIVVITSNSERTLPDAFLRRCVYYHIEAPKRERLEEILHNRLDSAYDKAFIAAALEVFMRLQEKGRIGKRPATAELLSWVHAMLLHKPGEANPLRDRQIALQTLGVLIKQQADLEQARLMVESWIKEEG